MESESRETAAIRVTGVTLVMNILLGALKLAAGILANSGAMISDAVHSLSDIVNTLLVMLGVRLAARAPDANHQYGHERFECLAAIVLAFILAIVGAGIGWSGISQIIAFGSGTGNGGGELSIPGMLALIAAAVSIVVKEGLYWFTRHHAKRLNSGVLMADAWHNRADGLSSIGSFAGILGARMGFPVLDPLASVVICVFIFKVAVDIFKDAASKMTDRAADVQTEQAITEFVTNHPGVLALDLLQTRVFGERLYVDIEIALDRNTPLHLAHDTAETVHDALEEAFPAIKHCMVHMNPSDEQGKYAE